MPTKQLTSPSLVIHCDWGTSPQKRWMAKATLQDGQYTAHAPELVGNLNDPHGDKAPFIDRIARERGSGQTALVGFDFPIGLPAHYAANIPGADFLTLLPQFGEGAWKDFYAICAEAADISILRPFYPYHFKPKGSKKHQHLIDGLNVKQFKDLLRGCEQPHLNRTAAGALFWTLGAKAPGRAAIIGWRDLIAPALHKQEIKLWPFQGDLDSLLQPDTTVLAETYPAEYYKAILGKLDGSKADQTTRKKAALKILQWTKNRETPINVSPSLEVEIQGGFSEGKDDAFDAVIGLFGMIDAIQNYSPTLEPTDPTIRKIEGWILGQPINN